MASARRPSKSSGPPRLDLDLLEHEAGLRDRVVDDDAISTSEVLRSSEMTASWSQRRISSSSGTEVRLSWCVGIWSVCVAQVSLSGTRHEADKFLKVKHLPRQHDHVKRTSRRKMSKENREFKDVHKFFGHEL